MEGADSTNNRKKHHNGANEGKKKKRRLRTELLLGADSPVKTSQG